MWRGGCIVLGLARRVPKVPYTITLIVHLHLPEIIGDVDSKCRLKSIRMSRADKQRRDRRTFCPVGNSIIRLALFQQMFVGLNTQGPLRPCEKQRHGDESVSSC